MVETAILDGQEILIYPLELPVQDGDTRKFGQNATVNLASCLRHFAVADFILDNNLDEDREEELDQEISLGTTQLISVLTSLVSLANLYNIDIMQEIYEVPWEV